MALFLPSRCTNCLSVTLLPVPGSPVMSAKPPSRSKPCVEARTAERAQPAFLLKNIAHNFPEYRASVLPIYENSAGEAALQ